MDIGKHFKSESMNHRWSGHLRQTRPRIALRHDLQTLLVFAVMSYRGPKPLSIGNANHFPCPTLSQETRASKGQHSSKVSARIS